MVGWHPNSKNMNVSKLWEITKDREACSARVYDVTRVRHDLVT